MKVLTALLIACFATLLGASTALGSQAYRYWSDTVDRGWKGSRVNIGNPDTSQASVSSGDWFLTSAYADDGPSGSNLIQVGVTYEYKAPEAFSCDLGSSTAKLYYFVEVENSGTYTCYGQGLATFATTHLQSVKRSSTNGVWYSFIDSGDTGITNYWSGCGGNACSISALGENNGNKAGAWSAKFAGSGNTPWQFWNGSVWNTINTANVHIDSSSPWAGPFGPFPAGIWSFTYSH